MESAASGGEGKLLLERYYNRGVSKAFQFYWRRARGLTMGAQCMVLDDDDRVLLVRHGYRPGWHFPGGGVEKNETVATALKRELDEETGVDLTEAPRLFAIYANFQAFPSDHIAMFVARAWRQPRVPQPNKEIAEQRFASRETLPTGTIEPVRRCLDEVLGDEVPREMW